MTNAEGVELAFGTPWKRMQTILLPNGVQLLLTASQNLVWIGLMTDIPDQLIMRSGIHIMQSHGQLNRA